MRRHSRVAVNRTVRCHLGDAVLTPVHDIRDGEVSALAEEASQFLLSHDWCKSVRSAHLAWAAAGVLGVFRFEIQPARPGVDELLWVVVGDLPSAYLVCEGNSTWREALEGYIYEMGRWVSAVRSGSALDDVIPTGVAPTVEHADMLEGRLGLISREILSADAGELVSDT